MKNIKLLVALLSRRMMRIIFHSLSRSFICAKWSEVRKWFPQVLKDEKIQENINNTLCISSKGWTEIRKGFYHFNAKPGIRRFEKKLRNRRSWYTLNISTEYFNIKEKVSEARLLVYRYKRISFIIFCNLFLVRIWLDWFFLSLDRYNTLFTYYRYFKAVPEDK